MSKSLNREIDDAIVAFANAKDHLDATRITLSRARNQETDAINRVNEAQKKLDELIAVLKKEAPRDTDWANQQRKKTQEKQDELLRTID